MGSLIADRQDRTGHHFLVFGVRVFRSVLFLEDIHGSWEP